MYMLKEKNSFYYLSGTIQHKFGNAIGLFDMMIVTNSVLSAS